MMDLRHKGQILFALDSPSYVGEHADRLKVFMLRKKSVADLLIFGWIQRAGGIHQSSADFDIFRGRTQNIILQKRQFVNISKGFVPYFRLSAKYSEA